MSAWPPVNPSAHARAVWLRENHEARDAEAARLCRLVSDPADRAAAIVAAAARLAAGCPAEEELLWRDALARSVLGDQSGDDGATLDPRRLATAAADAATPELVAAAGGDAEELYWTWLMVALRNRSTRKNYRLAAEGLFAFSTARGIRRLEDVTPLVVAAWIEASAATHAAGTRRLRLAAVRALFAFLVRRGMLTTNPALEVAGPRRAARQAAAPALSADEARRLLAAPDPATLIGLRDRALMAVMLVGLARVGAATGLRLGDVTRGENRIWLRLREKRGLVLDVPLDRQVSAWLDAYLVEAGLRGAREGWVFRAAAGRAGTLGERPLQPRNVHHMIRRRAREAGIDRETGCHALRATGITLMLAAGVRLEAVQRLAGHASPETTRLYDRRADAEILEGIDRAWL